MEKVNEYRQTIRRLINEYAQFAPSRGDVQIETIFDEANDHYELMYAGCCMLTYVMAKCGFNTMARLMDLRMN